MMIPTDPVSSSSCHLPPLFARRTLLKASLFGSAGLGAKSVLRANDSPSASRPEAVDGFGRAKQCLLLFMWGGPSQLDTFDPKPLAPETIRGPFKSIATNVPGIDFSENFQMLSQRADKLAVIRSLGHDDPAHLSSGHTVLTGHLPPTNKSDAVPPSDRDSPHIGCVMSKLRPSIGALPSFVTLPWLAYHPAAPGGQAPGQHSGWLGHQYDPFLVSGDPNAPGWQVPSLALIEGQSPDRLLRRQDLLASIDAQRCVDRTAQSERLTAQQQQACGLLTSSSVRRAFDLDQEPAETRDRYGRNTHGQCALLAKRLLDQGVPFVSVNWQNDGQNFWDTHSNNFNRLKNDLIPPADRALSAVLDDLAASGRLNETLVVWVGEFGRSPVINGSAGREHHPYCYSGLMAGGGVRGGQVYGASDNRGAYPSENPISPHDLVATMYHALGVSPELVLYDSLNRPHQLLAGRAVKELFV
jgi:Protein of unknown function (DUF1501)